MVNPLRAPSAQRNRFLLTVGALAVVLGFLFLARGALFPFLIGLVLSYLLLPLVRWIEQLRPVPEERRDRARLLARSSLRACRARSHQAAGAAGRALGLFVGIEAEDDGDGLAPVSALGRCIEQPDIACQMSLVIGTDAIQLRWPIFKGGRAHGAPDSV